MSLGRSINQFYRKYKKPLIIIVLVFFVYKVFSYYCNVYEGFDGATGPSSAELRIMANDARNQALEANAKRQMIEQYLLNYPDLAPERIQFAKESIARATAKANEMNLEADRLDKLVIETEAAEAKAQSAAVAAAQAEAAQAEAAQAAQAASAAAAGAGAAALQRMGRMGRIRRRPLRVP
jgi:preprotein translocase subunit SecF